MFILPFFLSYCLLFPFLINFLPCKRKTPPYTTNMRYIKWIAGLFVWLAVCQLPALISMPFVQPNMAWYHALIKPPISPPDWLFGVMWGALYMLMGVAAAVAFRNGISGNARPARVLFLVQLALNALWTPVYFGLHSLTGATILIVVMLMEGFYLHRELFKLDKLAAWLLMPYWGWLVFATYLTVASWGLNG